MIPTNRRVRGDDVVQTERRLALRPADMQWLLGANTHTYYRLRNDPGNDGGSKGKNRKTGLTQALIVRLLSQPDAPLPMIRPPRVSDVFELCQQIDPDFTPRHLGVLLGRDGASGYRWIHQDSGGMMRQEVARWMTIVWLVLTSAPSAKARKTRLTELMDMVVLEAALRGYDPAALRERFRFVSAAPKGRPGKGSRTEE